MAMMFVKNEEQRQAAILRIQNMPLPLTVNLSKGAQRTRAQNNTIYMWYADAAKALEDTPESIRAQCKLMFGVPILRSDDEEFRAWYDRTFMPLTYDTKLELFEKLDPAITSKMKVKQLTRYMDAMQKYFAPMGVHLRDPELMKYEAAA